jgi:hypothetical protein
MNTHSFHPPCAVVDHGQDVDGTIRTAKGPKVQVDTFERRTDRMRTEEALHPFDARADALTDKAGADVRSDVSVEAWPAEHT